MRWKLSSQQQGILLVFMAALIWGWNGSMTKKLNASGVDMLSVIFLRIFICVLVSSLYIKIFKKQVMLFAFNKDFLFLFLYGFLIVSGTALGFFCSMQYMSVTSALLLHYLFPVFTMIGSALLIREKPSAVQVLSAFLILLGVGFGLLNNPVQAKFIHPAGLFLGLLGALGFALQTLFARMYSANRSISQFALFYHGFLWSLIPIAFMKTVTIGWQDIVTIRGSDWLIILFLGVFGNFIAQMTYFKGLCRIIAPLGSLISSFELVSASIFAFLLSSEVPSNTELAGSALVIVAIALASYFRPASQGKQQ